MPTDAEASGVAEVSPVAVIMFCFLLFSTAGFIGSPSLGKGSHLSPLLVLTGVDFTTGYMLSLHFPGAKSKWKTGILKEKSKDRLLPTAAAGIG